MPADSRQIPVALLRSTIRQAAREVILPRFRTLALSEVFEKTGPNDLVTVADTEAEALITDGLARDWPEAVVMGEEAVAHDPALRDAMATADLAVILDPVDGTWNFAKGLTLFGVLVAVVQHGRPIWGMLYDPICDDWVEAALGQTTFHTASSTRPLHTAAAKPIGQLIGYAPSGMYPPAQKRAAALAGLPYARVTSLRCCLHEYRMLVQGHVDFALSTLTPHPWDHAAGVLAVQGAGGVARFLDGEPYSLSRSHGVILSASCEAVWQQVAKDFAALI